MPFLAPVVGAALSGGFITNLLIGTALSLGGSLLSKAMAPKTVNQDPGVQLTVQVGGNTPLSFIVGQAATSGHRTYAGSWGQSGSTPNAYYVDVLELANVPITALTGVYAEGERTNILWGEAHSEFGFPIQQARRDGVDHLWVKFYDGNQTVADPYLRNRFGGHADRPYTADMIGRGTAYAVVTQRYHKELWGGRTPGLLFEVQGMKLYDVRKDSSAGGSGVHRRNNPSTWEFTRNPYVIGYNVVFMGVYFGSEWVWGMQNLPATRLPQSSWIAAMNEADRVLAAWGNDAQFSIGGEITVDMQPADFLEHITKSTLGRIIETAGSYKPRCGLPGAAVWSFTEGELSITDPRVITPFPGLEQTHNTIRATYTEPAEAYRTKPAPDATDSAMRVSDQNRELVAGLSFPFVQDNEQAQRLAWSYLRDGRRFRTLQATFHPITWLLEPGDVIDGTMLQEGYAGKSFEILEMSGRRTFVQTITLREVDPADFDPPASAAQSWTVGPIKTIYPTPQAVSGFSASPVPGEIAYDVTWNALSVGEDVDFVRVSHRAQGSTVTRWSGLIPQPEVQAGKGRVYEGLYANEIVEVQIEYVPRSGRATIASGWQAVQIADVRIAIDDLTDELKEQFDEIQEWIDEGIPANEAAVAQLHADIEALDSVVTANYTSLTTSVQGVQTQVTNLGTLVSNLDAEVESNYTTVNANVAAVQTQVTNNLASVNAAVAGVQTQVTNNLNTLTNSISVVQAQVNDVFNADAWVNNKTYPAQDIVQYSGGLYRAKQAVPVNTLPTNTTYWEKIGNYTGLGAAVAGTANLLTQEVTRIDGVLTGQAASIVAVQAALPGKADAAALNSLTTRVEVEEGKSTAQGALLSSVQAQVANGPVLPSDFTNGGINFTMARGGSPSAVAPVPEANIVDDPDFGKAYRAQWNATGTNIMTRGVMPILPGRIYEVRIRYKVESSDGNVQFNINGAGLSDSYAEISNTFGPTETITTTGDVREIARRYSLIAGTNIQALPAAAKFLRGGLRLQSSETVASNFFIRVGTISILDITEAVNTASAVSGLDARVTVEEGKSTAQAGQISAVQAALPGKADATALESLTVRVTTEEGKSTSQGAQITSLQNALPGKADTSALTALDSKVTTMGTKVDANGTAITAVQARVENEDAAGNWVRNPMFVAAGQLAPAPVSNTTNIVAYHDASEALIPKPAPASRIGRFELTSTPSSNSLRSQTFTGKNDVTEINVVPGDRVVMSVDMYVEGSVPTHNFLMLTRVQTGGSQTNDRAVRYDYAAGGWQKLVHTYTVPIAAGAAQIDRIRFAIGFDAGPGADRPGLGARIFYANPTLQKLQGADASLATAQQLLDARVGVEEGKSTAYAASITALEAALPGKADATALASLTTRVQTEEGKSTSQGADIVSLQNALPGKADATALAALTTRVQTEEGKSTSQGSDIVALQNALPGKASVAAVSELATRVETEEGKSTAQGGQITAVQATLGGIGGNGSNLLPDEYSRISAASPATLGNLNQVTVAKVAQPASAGGFEYQITNTAANNTARVTLGPSYAAGNDNLVLEAGTYIFSFKGRCNVAGHQVGFLISRGGSFLTPESPSVALGTTDATYAIELVVTGGPGIVVLRTNRQGISGRIVSIYDLMIERKLGNSAVPSAFTPGYVGLRVDAQAQAQSALDARVTIEEGKSASQGSAITSLQNALPGKADASALAALTTRVTTEEGKSTSQGTDIVDIKANAASISPAGTNLLGALWSWLTSTTLPPTSVSTTAITRSIVPIAAAKPAFGYLMTRASGTAEGWLGLMSVNTEAARNIEVVPGTYIVSAFVRAVSGTPNLRPRLFSTPVSAYGPAQATSATRTRMSWEVVITAAARICTFWYMAAGATGDQLEIDSVMVERKAGTGTSSAPSAFVPGSSADEVAATATALSALDARVVVEEGKSSSISSDVTALTNTVAGKADASALAALTSRVETEEGKSTSQSSDLTALTNSLSTTNSNVAAAQSAAEAAATLAGSKGKVLVQDSAPAAADRNALTLWIDTTGGANTPKRWMSGTTWTPVTDKVATDAAAAAASALSQVATKAESSAVTELSNTVTQQGTTLSAQGGLITGIQATIAGIPNSGANLVPGEYGWINGANPPALFGSECTVSVAAYADSPSGFAIRATMLVATTTPYMLLSSGPTDFNMQLEPGTYIISWECRGTSGLNSKAGFWDGTNLYAIPTKITQNSGSVRRNYGQFVIPGTAGSGNTSFVKGMVRFDNNQDPDPVGSVQNVWNVMVERKVANQNAPSAYVPGPSARSAALLATAQSALDARVVIEEGKSTSMASDITGLTSTVAGKADSSALAALDTKVVEQGSNLSTLARDTRRIRSVMLNQALTDASDKADLIFQTADAFTASAEVNTQAKAEVTRIDGQVKSVASTLTELSSAVGSNLSQSIALIELTATEVAAQALAIEQLKVVVGEGEASYITKTEVTAGPSGFDARHTLRLQATTPNGQSVQVSMYFDIRPDGTARIGFSANETAFFLADGTPIALFDAQGNFRSANGAVLINMFNGNFSFGLP